MSIISDADSAPGGSSSLPFRSHIVRNRSCYTATANCLFAPYLFIYTLVALVSYIDQNAIIECRVCVLDRDQPESNKICTPTRSLFRRARNLRRIACPFPAETKAKENADTSADVGHTFSCRGFP